MENFDTSDLINSSPSEIPNLCDCTYSVLPARIPNTKRLILESILIAYLRREKYNTTRRDFVTKSTGQQTGQLRAAAENNANIVPIN